MHDVTLVTALFDLGRGRPVAGLADYQRRSFDEYLSSFERVLMLDAPLCVYVEPELEPFVWRFRDRANTRVIPRTLAELRDGFPFFEQVQRIRTDPAWRARAGWLAESPQAHLEFYNPVVMSKMAMLNDQQLLDPFGTDRFLWIDAGLARTCGYYLNNPEWLRRVGAVLERFLFICFPYIGNDEIHGFDRGAMARLAETDYVRRVARGGLFGGTREHIAEANRLYYRLLELSLAQGEMGTEESIFTIMSYLEPERFDRFEIGANGLIGPFFEALLAGPVALTRTRSVATPRKPAATRAMPCPRSVPRPADRLSTVFYILTFNQPRQLELLIESWQQQPDFLQRSAVVVIDNSTDADALNDNRAFCTRQGFEHVARGNLGICGGRQLAAELFDASTHDYMFFLEDDMLLAVPDLPPCPAGMRRWIDGLYGKLLRIMEQEGFDFLKLSFAEFYGLNSEQWAWYNVPPDVRRRCWPEQAELPREGLAPRIPPVAFERIAVCDGLAYASGEVYYANWPQIVSREGNRRMFLETRWARPFEQTWMSHMFQQTRRGALRPAVLLASPIEHRREFHYAREERVES